VLEDNCNFAVKFSDGVKAAAMLVVKDTQPNEDKFTIFLVNGLKGKRKAVTFGDVDPDVDSEKIITIMTKSTALAIYKGNIVYVQFNLFSIEYSSFSVLTNILFNSSQSCETEENPNGKNIFSFSCPVASQYVDNTKAWAGSKKEPEEVDADEEKRISEEELATILNPELQKMVIGAPVFNMNIHVIGTLDGWTARAHNLKFGRKSICDLKEFQEKCKSMLKVAF
jgi:hypothetical protein